jgi:hypothetical protein
VDQIKAGFEIQKHHRTEATVVSVDVWSVIKDFASGFWIVWARAAGVKHRARENPPGCSNESRGNKLWEVFGSTVSTVPSVRDLVPRIIIR